MNGRTLAEISAQEIDCWLRTLKAAHAIGENDRPKPLSAVGRNNFRRVLVVAFNFAMKRGYCATNPAVETAKAKEIETAVGILTVDQTAALLSACSDELVPFIAIGAFAGLRRAELERLDRSEIDLEGSLIQVLATKAKSAQRRFVKIRPNLDAWIRPLAKHGGPVAPSNYRELLDVAREAAGIDTWPQNALRHSFASYALAAENDAAALALELGHKNSNLVFQHYREAVKPKQAERYWNLKPASDAGRKIVAWRNGRRWDGVRR